MSSRRVDPLIVTLLLLSVLLSLAFPEEVIPSLKMVNVRALLILTAFMVLSELWKKSLVFEWAAVKLTSKGGSKALIMISALAGALMMNDAAMFFMIPLALVMEGSGSLVPIVAMAVNLGSAITPFGNPQNVVIWTHYNLDVIEYIVSTLPAFLPLLVLLSLIAPEVRRSKRSVCVNRKKLWISIVALIITLVLIEFSREIEAVLFSAALYLVIERKVPKVDINLLIILTLMMYSFGLIGKVFHVTINNPLAVLWTSALLSQLISNVPVTLMLIVNNPPWLPLAVGVDLGGLGTPIASLSNLIALRLSGYDYLEFTKSNLLVLLIGLAYLTFTSLLFHYP